MATAAAKKPEPDTETAQPGAAAPAEPKRTPPIPQNRFDLLEQRNPGYWIELTPEYTIESLADPAVWANIAGSGKLRARSTIEAHWSDGSQFALLYVRDCGRSWAVVKLLSHWRLDDEPIARPSRARDFRVHENGVVDKWRIIDITNNSVLKAGFMTETAARSFLEEHLKKIGLA